MSTAYYLDDEILFVAHSSGKGRGQHFSINGTLADVKLKMAGGYMYGFSIRDENGREYSPDKLLEKLESGPCTEFEKGSLG